MYRYWMVCECFVRRARTEENTEDREKSGLVSGQYRFHCGLLYTVSLVGGCGAVRCGCDEWDGETAWETGHSGRAWNT